ncbi:acyltransferase domain-containing protein, partial [Nocardia sp. NPDC048505]|uniref:acyltransferase domain-containing protein n=1 Tax=Nocardia sp. NPDC048505 TaxID=3155756 RepID=UPI0033E66826
WVLSGRTPTALTHQATRLHHHLTTHNTPPTHTATTLTRRTTFDHRAIILGTNTTELTTALTALTTAKPAPGLITGTTTTGTTGLVFSGQGTQRLGMGHQLARTYPAFATALDEVTTELDQWLEKPLLDIMWGTDPTPLHTTQYAQPALFALQTALFRLLQSWSVTIDIVMGHSVGEITAAHIAGTLTLPHAAQLITTRARLMQTLPTNGAMIAIQATETEVTQALRDGVDIAAINTEHNIVISGHAPTAQAIAATFTEQGRKTTPLRVSHAFHSTLMEPILEQFLNDIAHITPTPPRIPLISNLTGQLTDHHYATPTYWRDHIRQPVRFAQSITTMTNTGTTRILEAGPDTTLTTM